MSNMNRSAAKMAEASKRIRPSTKSAKPSATVFGRGNPNTAKTQPDKTK